MAEVLITYKAEADSLEAVVKEAVKGNVAIAESATKAGQVASKAYKDTANSAKAAFGSQEVKKSLDSQVQSIDKLKAGVELLYKEQVKIIQQSGKQSEAFKNNIKAAADLRAQIDTLTKEQNGYSVATGKAAEKSVSLKTQLKNLKAELSALDAAGKSGSKQFNDLAISAARLEDQISDTQQRVKVLASDTFAFDAAIGAVKGLAAGFAVAQGAVGLFAKDNEELQMAIAKTNSAIAILTGLQEIANIVTGQGAEKIGILTLAQSAYGLVVGKSTGAMKLFRIALAGTGVGLLVIGLMELIENFDKVKSAISNAIPGFDSLAEGIGKAIDKTKEFLGIDAGGENAKKALDNLIGVEKRKTDFQVKALERRINLLDAGNKKTTDLEIKKEQIQIESLKRIINAIRKNGDELVKLDEDARIEINNKAREMNAEILDRENAIQVLRIKGSQNVKKIKKEEGMELLKMQADIEAASLEQYKKYQDNLLEIATLNKKSLLKLDQTTNEELQNQRSTFLKAEIAEGDNSLATKRALINSETDAKIAGIRETLGFTRDAENLIRILNAQRAKQLTEVNTKAIDEILMYAQVVGQTLTAINDLQKQLSENRIADITAEKDVQLAAINESFDTERSKIRQRAALELRTNRAIAAEKTKQAKADKALALFNAIIGTAAAVATAKTLPLKIIAGFIGAAQIAIILAKPIPKFAQGGVVGGQLHAQGGTQIEAEKDEYIVKRSQSVKHRKELDAINTSTQAFRNMINERYVRPAIMNYVLNSQQERGVTVNASLNSKSMEAELKGLRKDIRNSRTRSINSQLDSRYSWQ
jgi:hypothetical protein